MVVGIVMMVEIAAVTVGTIAWVEEPVMRGVIVIVGGVIVIVREVTVKVPCSSAPFMQSSIPSLIHISGKQRLTPFQVTHFIVAQ